MVTFFGISGEACSLLTQLLAMGICFLIGLAGFRGSLFLVALIFGIAANVLGQIVFAGGGPGACVGFVAIPLMCLLSAWMGRGTWWSIWGRKIRPPVCDNCGAILPGPMLSVCLECGQPPHCRACGYNLKGNTSGRCPECGLSISETTSEDRS